MQKPVAKQLTAWSFSRYSTYDQCPLKCKLANIDRLKEPTPPAMQRGAGIHNLAERYLKGLIKRLPKELAKFKVLFAKLKKRVAALSDAAAVEATWAFRKDWSDTKWDDWAGCWLRAKVDLAYMEGDVLVVRDWKTGKFKDEDNAKYLQQLELYALSGLLKYPQAAEARPCLVYLDEGREFPLPETPIRYTRADIPHLKKAWEGRVKKMLADKTFKPKPNRWCPWCFYRKSNTPNNGGKELCKF